MKLFKYLPLLLVLVASHAVAQAPTYVNNGSLASINGVSGPGSGAVDRTGAVVVSYAPASSTFYSCSSTVTTTALTNIKAGVLNNRIYVTSIQCTNTSAVASLIAIKDGTTDMTELGIAAQATNGGYVEATFLTPLRTSVSAALNLAIATTSTNTICCAAGYVSPN